MRTLTCLVFLSASIATAQQLPVIAKVDHQPLAAQVLRLLEALEVVGEPLPADETAELKRLAGAPADRAQAVARDPEDSRPPLPGGRRNQSGEPRESAGRPGQSRSWWSRAGARSWSRCRTRRASRRCWRSTAPTRASWRARPRAWWRAAGSISRCSTSSPCGRGSPAWKLEYRILQLYSRDAGKREAQARASTWGRARRISASAARSIILFTAQPATKVTLRVLDSDDRPTTGFVPDPRRRRTASIRRRPSASRPISPFSRRSIAPTASIVLLPPGDYTVEYTRGPEYRKKTQQHSRRRAAHGADLPPGALDRSGQNGLVFRRSSHPRRRLRALREAHRRRLPAGHDAPHPGRGPEGRHRC